MAESANDRSRTASELVKVQVLITVEVDPADLNGHPGGIGEEILDMVDDVFKVGGDTALGLVDCEIYGSDPNGS